MQGRALALQLYGSCIVSNSYRLSKMFVLVAVPQTIQTDLSLATHLYSSLLKMEDTHCCCPNDDECLRTFLRSLSSILLLLFASYNTNFRLKHRGLLARNSWACLDLYTTAPQLGTERRPNWAALQRFITFCAVWSSTVYPPFESICPSMHIMQYTECLISGNTVVVSWTSLAKLLGPTRLLHKTLHQVRPLPPSPS